MRFSCNTFYTAVLAALLLGALHLKAQRSTFDTDNEGWGADGDPVSSAATWIPAGGNPGGHIRVADAAVGSVWYFVAPPKFRGNQCGAYGRYLRWEQYINDTTQMFGSIGGRPDVVLAGGGLTLVYDQPYNPGLTWTPFEVLLREDAGWRLNNLNGPAPTQSEFRTVLANISALRIRGEFRTGPDFSGLENVVLENGSAFDLDADDSSGNTNDGFFADTLCGSPWVAAVVDTDVLLASERRVDSLTLRLLLGKDADQERLELSGPVPATLSVVQHSEGWLVLVNNGAASVADFVQALLVVRYRHTGASITAGERLVALQPYGECGGLGVRYAYLHLAQAGSAGLSTEVVACEGGPPVSLFSALGGAPTAGGLWVPALPNGRFDPKVHLSGEYRYVVLAASGCPADTAVVSVRVEPAFRLGADTTLCRGEVLRLNAPDYLVQWQWSSGSRQPFLDVSTPGQYALQGSTPHCVFSDTIAVSIVECDTCSFYAPNVFSPNDDGIHDEWQIFLSCFWVRFRLAIFDRWGNLVFEAHAPQMAWSGQWRGRPATPSVYTWVAEWEVETLRGRQLGRRTGDVLLLR